jgi:hypothetical protein
MLSNDFTENHLFEAKIDWNYIFLGHDPHIMDCLYITVPYMSFYGFQKNLNFHSKSIRVSLRFYWNRDFGGKNWSKLYISWSWPPYNGSVMVPYMYFYIFWKFQIFAQNPYYGSVTVLPKIVSLGHKLTDIMYFLVRTPILWIGYT